MCVVSVRVFGCGDVRRADYNKCARLRGCAARYGSRLNSAMGQQLAHVRTCAPKSDDSGESGYRCHPNKTHTKKRNTARPTRAIHTRA